MKIRNIILAVITACFAQVAICESLSVQFVIDDAVSKTFQVDLATNTTFRHEPNDNLLLVIHTSTEDHYNVKSTLYSFADGVEDVLHKAKQLKVGSAGTNLYLVCKGKLAKFISPFTGPIPRCPTED